jgi:tetratricopeptide (TPR) repeat protein
MILGQMEKKLNEARGCLLAGNAAKALPLYESVTRQYPGVAVAWFEYGNAAAKLRKFELAERGWLKAAELEPGNAELLAMIGHQYQAARRPELAGALFVRAAAADAHAINPRISLAVISEKMNRLPEARAAVEECLRINALDDQARYFAAVLDRREGALEAAESKLRDLIGAEPKHPFVRYAARYELAQILDRTERFDEAMRWLAEAKEMVFRLTDANRLLQSYDQGAESVRRFTANLPKEILHTWSQFYPLQKREGIPPLVFLGGHPRSGTTLLEQVLDAHPGVAAADEPGAFLEVLQPEFHRSAKLSSPRVNQLRRLYLQALSQDLGSDVAGKVLIDKNPSPTARLPLWLRVFPELRVLIALRDPRDVMISCYFQNIPLNSTNVNFLSFERLAKHYADLMDVWLAVREWTGFEWRETRYEDLVANLEGEGRRVTEFLGLTWHEGQMRFYEQSARKQLYSPTYQDVTKPIYHRSVARWRAYEKYLAPILPSLEKYCRAFGYSC